MSTDTYRKLLRSVLLVFLVLLVGTLLAIVASVAVEGVWRARIEPLSLTALALVFAGLIVLGSLFAFTRRRGRVAGGVGVVFALGMLGLSLVLIWRAPRYPQSKEYEFWCSLTATWAASAGALALLPLARLPASLRLVQYLARGAVAALALLITIAICDEYNYLHMPEGWNRQIETTLVTGSILTGCLLLSVPLLHWFNALRERVAETTALRLWLRCPRCGREQELAAGGATCVQCRLRLRIEIEEERCPACGYPLYRLTSSKCPECGTPIPAYSAAEAREPGGP